jgi:hypothetical protein
MAQVRKRRGRIQLHLDANERAAIAAILDDLSPHLGSVIRTKPVAYSEPAYQHEYARWVVPEVERNRNADLDVVRDCLASGEDMSPLTDAQALAWSRALNHLRLAAGGLLGIEEDGWELEIGASVRVRPEYRMLMALGILQEELVAALES